MARTNPTRTTAAVVTAATKGAAVRRRRAEAVLAEVIALKTTIATTFYALGKLLRTLHDDKLFFALGYASFETLLAERVGIAKSTAYELIAVVEKVPRKIAVGLGASKAYDLVRYAAAGHRSIAETTKGKMAKVGTRAIKQATRAKESAHDPARREAEIAAKQMEHRFERLGIDGHAVVRSHGKRWRIVIDIAVENAGSVAPTT
jgi:hypothetical protein